jgi:hypothetical protein
MGRSSNDPIHPLPGCFQAASRQVLPGWCYIRELIEAGVGTIYKAQPAPGRWECWLEGPRLGAAPGIGAPAPRQAQPPLFHRGAGFAGSCHKNAVAADNGPCMGAGGRRHVSNTTGIQEE